jgi:hypothetical protein
VISTQCLYLAVFEWFAGGLLPAPIIASRDNHCSSPYHSSRSCMHHRSLVCSSCCAVRRKVLHSGEWRERCSRAELTEVLEYLSAGPVDDLARWSVLIMVLVRRNVVATSYWILPPSVVVAGQGC